jgi:two-component system NtrC family response regulator
VATVLLVDSDPVFTRSFRASLERRGYEILDAGTARLGVERLREGGIDVVVVDSQVAGGVSVLVSGIGRLPDPPPFVLVSAEAEAPALSARLGAAAFQPKPCDLEELGVAIDRLLGPTPQAIGDDQETSPVIRPK